jgi:hypothetical protein
MILLAFLLTTTVKDSAGHWGGIHNTAEHPPGFPGFNFRYGPGARDSQMIIRNDAETSEDTIT